MDPDQGRERQEVTRLTMVFPELFVFSILGINSRVALPMNYVANPFYFFILRQDLTRLPRLVSHLQSFQVTEVTGVPHHTWHLISFNWAKITNTLLKAPSLMCREKYGDKCEMSLAL